MTLSEVSIKRPVFAWMLMAALITFGLIAFKRMGISQLPDVDFPVVSVGVTLPGAAPEVVEGQVLDVLEDSIMQIDGIRSLTSTAQQNSGSIAVEFELNRNIDQAMQEVQDRIAQAQNLLPPTLFPPRVRKSNPEDQPILWLALTSDNPNEKRIDMMIYARNTLQDQFGMVTGVGDIVVGGYVDPALRVWTDLDQLEKYDLTAGDVVTAIQQEQVEIPTGLISNDRKEYNLRLMGEAWTPKDFGNIRIASRKGLGVNYKPTLIHQVADIEEGTADVRRISRFNGKLAVGLGVIKQHGSNAVEVANAVRAKLEEIRPYIPKGFHVDVRSDNTRFIKQSVDHLNFTLLLSALLTSLVCYLFLGSWSSTLNVLMAIPTSIVGSFTVLYFFGFTLNTFTLLGLSLAIGIVVDDAIMMLENIVRHRELGKSKRQAALVGSKEITFAAVAATIAVVAIFLPVVFMKGVIGRYFYQYGITVTAAVLLSLLEAITLTPMRCSRFLRVEAHAKGLAGAVDRFFHRMSARYGEILKVLLRHRVKAVVITSVIFVLSLFVLKSLPSEMIPPQDQGMLIIRLKLPVDAGIDVTNAKTKAIEDYLQKQPEVEGAFSAVGGFGGDAVNQSQVTVSLVDKSKRKASQQELLARFRTDLSQILGVSAGGGAGKKGRKGGRGGKGGGAQLNIQDPSMRGFSSGRGFPVEFIVQGPDWDQLTEETNKVVEKLGNSGFLADVNTDIQPNMPELRLIPNREKLAKHAVSLNNVTSTINALLGGAILNGANEYPKGNHRYEIEVRLIAAQRDKIPDLNRIRIRNNRGETIRLLDLVDEKIEPSLKLISRLDRARAVKVYANPAPGVSQQEAMLKTEALAKATLSPGYSVKMTGSSQSFRESMQSLLWALALGILVSYMVLASQFNSFIHPVAVLMALPFSFTGAFIGLWIRHQSINIFSMIGLILLMGIVKKNSILLVDFTNQKRAEGMDVQEALIHACPVRLRPILMTSVATVAAALPEALSFGPGAESMVPMAIAIIGGVVASTLLTLFVVPCVYSLLVRFESKDPLELAERAQIRPVRA